MKQKNLDGLKTTPEAKIYKDFSSEIKASDDIKRTLTVIISTPNADRSGDTMDMKGMEYKNFLNNAVVLFAHDYKSKPIAKCINLNVTSKNVTATIEFPPEGIYKEADIIYWMYQNKFLNAWSIGFMPLDYDRNEKGGFEFKSWELFEFSSVPVPDNPEALTVIRSKGIDVDLVVAKKEIEKAEVKDAPVDEPKEEITEEPKEEIAEEIKDEEKEVAEGETKDIEVKDADNPANPGYTDDTKIRELTVGQLKNIVDEVLDAEEDEDEAEDGEKAVKEAVTKDLGEVINLAYILGDLSFAISWFEDNGVNEGSLNKLKQAQTIIMDVIKDQAEIGKKEITITRDAERKALQTKAGRTISAENEDKLKTATDHMTKAVAHVNDVLGSVNQQNPSDTMNDDDSTKPEDSSNGDQGKSITDAPLLKRLNRLTQSVQKIENSQKTNNQLQGLTLRLVKQITSEKGE